MLLEQSKYKPLNISTKQGYEMKDKLKLQI